MQQISRKVAVARFDPDYDPEAGTLEFRLTYEGDLFAHRDQDQDNDTPERASHKQEIRQHFHHQLKRLWEKNRFLRLEWSGPHGKSLPLVEHLATMFPRDPYRFVPLVWKDASLLCGLDVLLLWTGKPGGVVHGGDLDNRLKTLLDALRMPTNTSEFGRYTTPGPDEAPFYVLLENDNLVSNFRVESDSILDVKPDHENSYARVIITVRIKPYGGTYGNLRYL